MLLKHDVKIAGIKPELMMGLMVADTLYNEAGVNLVVTSVLDSKHSRTSRHYIGFAADLRTRDLPNPKAMADRLAKELPEFYVVLECEGEPNQHLHMQFNGTYPS